MSDYEHLDDEDEFEEGYHSCCGEEICEACEKPYVQDITGYLDISNGLCECQKCASEDCPVPLTGARMPEGDEHRDYCITCVMLRFGRHGAAMAAWAAMYCPEMADDWKERETKEGSGKAPRETTTEGETK